MMDNIVQKKEFRNIVKRITDSNHCEFVQEHQTVPVFDLTGVENKTDFVEYVYGDLKNEHIYVGITRQGWKIRNSAHWKNNRGSLIDEKLVKNHQIVLLIVGYANSVNELSKWEHDTICRLHCCIYDEKYEKGYNKTFGGDFGCKEYNDKILLDQSKAIKAWIIKHPLEFAEIQRKAAETKRTVDYHLKASKNKKEWNKNNPEAFNKMQMKAKLSKQTVEFKNKVIKRNKKMWADKTFVLNQILKHQGKIKITCEKDIFDFVNEVNHKLYIGMGYSAQARNPKYNGITSDKFREKFIACSKYCEIIPVWNSKMYNLSSFGVDQYIYQKVFKWVKKEKSFSEILQIEYPGLKISSRQLSHQYNIVCERNNWPKC